MNVVGFGTVAMDVLMQTAELPAEDGFAVIEKSEYLPGGSGTNVIAQLSRLGASCGFVAQIGDDTVGAQIRQSLRDEGIDDSGLNVLPGGQSLHTKILVDAKGRKFILLDMGTAFLSLPDKPENVAYCLRGDILYTDLLPGAATIAAVKAAKAQGKKTVFNMQIGLPMMEGMGVSKEMILDVLPHLDVFAPCRDGLFALAGTQDVAEAAAYVRQYFKGLLLVTLGGEGSVAYEADGTVTRVPVDTRAAVVDTTGAGDSYLGGFIYDYLIRQRPLRDAMWFATVCAGCTCGKMGARSGPTLAQVEALLLKQRRPRGTESWAHCGASLWAMRSACPWRCGRGIGGSGSWATSPHCCRASRTTTYPKAAPPAKLRTTPHFPA